MNIYEQYVAQETVYPRLPGPQRLREGRLLPEDGYKEKGHEDSQCSHGWYVWPNYWVTADNVVHGIEQCL